MIVGNLHKSPQGIRDANGKILSLITLPLRSIDLASLGHKEATGTFRRFVESIALDCLWLGMANQQAALHDILDQAVQIDQATLDDAEVALQALDLARQAIKAARERGLALVRAIG